jgi:hypothetical protein
VRAQASFLAHVDALISLAAAPFALTLRNVKLGGRPPVRPAESCPRSLTVQRAPASLQP